MAGIRKSITFLLMICMIGYGSAWAFESHAVEMDEVDSVITLIDKQSVDQHVSDNDACDHCCHAFAHMLALCAQSVYPLHSNKTFELQRLSQNFPSLIVSPDIKPPRV